MIPNGWRSLVLALVLVIFGGLSGGAMALTCDVDADGGIDRDDLGLIQQAILKRIAPSASDPRDADGNGVINSVDGRLCALRCTRPSCAAAPPSEFPVGPQGGKLSFPNGIVLDVPAGAVTETVYMQVSDLPCDQVDEILLSQGPASPGKRCLRGFSLKPDGLVLNVPITAIVPVELQSGEIPVQIVVDLNDRLVRITDAELQYRGPDRAVTMSVAHFSDEYLAALLNLIDETCKLCATYDPAATVCGPLAAPSPYFEYLQPGACLLLAKERDKPACQVPGLRCCMEELMDVKVSEAEFVAGVCQIVGAKVTAAFPTCSDPTPRTLTDASSAGCPPDAIYKLDIVSDKPSIYRCQDATLQAKLSATSASGNVLFEAAVFPAEWNIISGESTVAALGPAVGPSGTVIKGLQQAGEARIRASALGAESELHAEYLLRVEQLKPDITPGDDLALSVGETSGLWVPCLVCPHPIRWVTDRPDVVNLTNQPGDAVVITAIARGTAQVFARTEDHCGLTVEDTVTVAVKKTEVTVRPEKATIAVGGTQQLDAEVIDGQGCAVAWSSDNIDIATVSPTGLVTGAAPGTANIQASCRGASGVGVITVRTPGFLLTWQGTETHITEDSCVFPDAFGHYVTALTKSWSGSATIEQHRNVVSLSTDASVAGDSFRDYSYLNGACTNHDETHHRWSLNPAGIDRVRSNLSGIGVYVTDTPSGPVVRDPLLGGGCSGTLSAHQTYSGVFSHTCPAPGGQSRDSWENEDYMTFCFNDAPLKADASGHSFSKLKTSDSEYTEPYDCGRGVTGTRKVSAHKQWDVRVVKSP